MNSKKFGKITNHKQEPWKAPLPVFMEDPYFKRFGKKRPGEVKSIGQAVKKQGEKKVEHRRRKEMEKGSVATKAGDSDRHSLSR